MSPHSMSDQDYRPIKRIRQACQNCRRKKARCTGEKPECAFCVRLGQHCSYSDDDSPPSTSTYSGNGQRRYSTVRFQGTDKDSLAARISAIEEQMVEVVSTVKGLESTINNSLNQLSRTLSTVSAHGLPQGLNGVKGEPGSLESSNSLPYSRLPPIEMIREAADLYFKFCHNQPYSLFHEGNLRNKIDLNEMPAHLQFALLASTVRYSSNPFFQDKNAAVSGYANQSWKAIVMPWNGIQSDAELSIVQTILLLAIIDYTDGRTQASWIKVGLAIRLAQDFRLMMEPDQNLSPIHQEERRRVFWSFYLCDKLISCGRERPAAILDDQCKLQLPTDENVWRAGHLMQMPTLEQLSEDNTGSALSGLSPFAVATVVGSLLGRCAQYALGEQEEQTPGGKLLPWNPRSKYSSIHSAILQYESELGLNESLSEKITQTCMNADGNVDQHRAAPLALAHALFYLCQCLLYHPFLLKQRLSRVNQRTPQSFLTQTLSSCRLAASALSRLMDDVKSLNCETLMTSYDPFYGYCTMVAGVIHIMFFQASDPLVRETANISFESSMQNLKELSFYWKSCAMMHSRLEEFRVNSDRYSGLVDPTVQDVNLSASDINDLQECLDYARMSTTPRRKSQSSEFPALSQLPSPFFEELVNLLPLSYSRPVSARPLEGIFAQPPSSQAVFDSAILSDGSTVNLY